MIIKLQYTSPSERESLITQNSNLYLIEEQNLFEGNFLIFSDVQPEVITREIIKETITLTKDDFDGLQNRLAATEDALLALLLEGGV